MTIFCIGSFRGTLPLAVSGRGIRIVDDRARSTSMPRARRGLVPGSRHPDGCRRCTRRSNRLASRIPLFRPQSRRGTGRSSDRTARLAWSHVYLVSAGRGGRGRAQAGAQYFVESGSRSGRHFIGRKQSYHGNTSARSPSAATNGGAGNSRRCDRRDPRVAVL